MTMLQKANTPQTQRCIGNGKAQRVVFATTIVFFLFLMKTFVVPTFLVPTLAQLIIARKQKIVHKTFSAFEKISFYEIRHPPPPHVFNDGLLYFTQRLFLQFARQLSTAFSPFLTTRVFSHKRQFSLLYDNLAYCINYFIIKQPPSHKFFKMFHHCRISLAESNGNLS